MSTVIGATGKSVYPSYGFALEYMPHPVVPLKDLCWATRCCMPISWDLIDHFTIPTSEGVVFIQRRPTVIQCLHAGFDRFDRDTKPNSLKRRVLRLFGDADFAAAAAAVGVILERLVGVHEEEAKDIVLEVQDHFAMKKAQ